MRLAFSLDGRLLNTERLLWVEANQTPEGFQLVGAFDHGRFRPTMIRMMVGDESAWQTRKMLWDALENQVDQSIGPIPEPFL